MRKAPVGAGQREASYGAALVNCCRSPIDRMGTNERVEALVTAVVKMKSRYADSMTLSAYRALGLCTLTMRADCTKKGGSPLAASEAAETCSV